MKKQRQQQKMTPRLNVLSLREQVYEYLKNEMVTGGMVNDLPLEDVKHAYDSIGIIKAAIVQNCFDQVNFSHISRLERLN